MGFLEEMRQRPEEERLAFAMMAAGIVAVVLFLIWGATFFTNNTTSGTVQSDEQNAAAANGLRNMSAEVTGAVNQFSGQYAQLKDVLDSVSTTTEQGTNAVDLSVDEYGDVHVDNIIIQKEELGTEQ